MNTAKWGKISPKTKNCTLFLVQSFNIRCGYGVTIVLEDRSSTTCNIEVRRWFFTYSFWIIFSILKKSLCNLTICILMQYDIWWYFYWWLNILFSHQYKWCVTSLNGSLFLSLFSVLTLFHFSPPLDTKITLNRLDIRD